MIELLEDEGCYDAISTNLLLGRIQDDMEFGDHLRDNEVVFITHNPRKRMYILIIERHIRWN